ncbi:hypothetical protein IMAU10062_03090 [Lactiplantibacillus plantarum]|nr:hypothetical protein [Lactiplantibacillus plantarum]
MTRDQAFSLAKVFGAKPQNWVTKQTDYLVVGLIETALGENVFRIFSRVFAGRLS